MTAHADKAEFAVKWREFTQATFDIESAIALRQTFDFCEAVDGGDRAAVPEASGQKPMRFGMFVAVGSHLINQLRPAAGSFGGGDRKSSHRTR
jgi:hypothetical protein